MPRGANVIRSGMMKRAQALAKRKLSRDHRSRLFPFPVFALRPLFVCSRLCLSFFPPCDRRTLPTRRSNSYPRRAGSCACVFYRSHGRCFVNYTSFLSDSAATARLAVTMKRASRVSPPIRRRFLVLLRRRFFADARAYARGFRCVSFARAEQSTNDTVARTWMPIYRERARARTFEL